MSRLGSGLQAILACLLLCIPHVYSQSSFKPIRPPAIPLAVKSPYLNTIQQAGSGQGSYTSSGNGGYLAGEWPTFWAGQITGWTGMVRVDRAIYTWLGAPNISGVVPPLATQTAFEYTSTKSIFTFEVGGAIKMVVTFLSNVSPTDYRRQSLPFSYMNVEVTSLDGHPHYVQLYSDISAEWVSGDRSAIAQWDYGVIRDKYRREVSVDESEDSEMLAERAPQPTGTVEEEVLEQRDGPFPSFGQQQYYTGWTTAVDRRTHSYEPKTSGYILPFGNASPTYKPTATLPFNPPTQRPGGVAYHKVYRQKQLLFSEVGQQAEWGYWYYLTDNAVFLTHQSGSDADVRGQFLSRGFLTNQEDTNYRAINDSFPVFGFSKNLGYIGGPQWWNRHKAKGSTSSSMLFAISLAQEKAVQFESAQGNITQPSLWTSYFNNELDAMDFYFNDYSTQTDMSNTIDNKIATDALAVGGQNYLTITSLALRQAFGSTEFTGTPTNILTFLKEISSDGNTQTVDVIFPFHPMVIYLNPAILKQMLDPLFINQEAGFWPFKYSIHDIGANFPNATGHNGLAANQTEMQPLEECGNMIIMTLAYAQRTNDDDYLKQHYPILRQWNDYLVNDSLIPSNQISTDDFAGSLANQTNLALKGIVGIAAMAEIATRTGHMDDAANYTNISTTYIKRWQQLGINKAANPPHTTLNYGNDSTYGLLYNLWPDRELSLGLVPQYVYDQQSNYYPTQALEYGVPLDSRHQYTKSDWETWCASIASTSTRDLFYSLIAKYLDNTPVPYAEPDLYQANNASIPMTVTPFISRPVVGGHFAPLALLSKPSTNFLTGDYTA